MAVAPQPPTREERAGSAPRRRRWRWLVVLAIVVATPLVILKTDMVGRFAARALEEALEVATGEDVSIGRIEVGYLPPSIAIHGFVMTHPETAETIAVVAGAKVEAGFDGWLPALKRVSIDGPRVSLHLDEDGLRELRGLPKAPSGAPRPRRFPWKELVIRDGAFRLTTPSAVVDLQGIAVEPEGDTLDLSVGALRVEAGSIVQEAQAIVIPGVTLTPREITVPELDLHTGAIGVDGAFSAVADGLLWGNLALSVDLRALTLKDPERPHAEGIISVDVGLGGRTDAPLVDGAIEVVGLDILRAGKPSTKVPNPPLVHTRIGDVFGPWRLLPDVEPATISVGQLEMDWALGTIWVNAEVVPSTKAIRGDVTAEGIHLARILQSAGVAPTPWADLTGDVETHVVGTLAPFRLDGPFEVAVEDFYVDKGPIDGDNDTVLAIGAGSVVGQLELDLSALVLDARVVSGRSHGHARASIGFQSYGPLGVDVDFPALDLEVLRPLGDAELGGTARVEGWVGGRYDAPMSANATIAVQDAVVLGLPIADTLEANLTSDLVRLDFTDIRARLGDTHYQGDFEIAFTDPMWIDTQVYVSDGRIHDLAGIFLDIGGADGAVSGNIVLSGGPYTLDGDVRLTMGAVDLYGEHFDGGDAVAWMDDGELTLERFLLGRGAETLLVRGSVKRGFRLNLDVLGDGFALERLDHLAKVGLPLEGQLAVDAVVGGTLFEPEPRGRLASTRTYYNRRRLADTVLDFETHDGTLAWKANVLGDAMSARGTLGFYGEQDYEAEAELTGFPVHLFYPRGQDGSDVEARLGGELFLAGHFGDHPAPVDIEGRFDEAYARWSGHTLSAPEPWVFAVHGTSVQLPRLRLEGDDGTRLGFEGYTTAKGDLEFRGGGSVNLDLARAFVPELEVAQGMAELDIGIERDTAGTPHLAADVRLEDATLRTGYFPADFEDLSARIEATSTGYTIHDVKAEVGGGEFVSKESHIEAEDWWPNRFALEGTLTDARVQYLDYLPPMVGDADLRFDGPTDDLLLSGRIGIDDMVFSDRIDWEAMVISLRQERLTGSAPEEGKEYFAMDLEITADDSIRLRNNVAEADASADLRIIGDTARPGMVGEINLEPGGQVYLHEREFEIGRGEIRYIDPYTFDPDLDIQLETEVRSHEQDYRVTYGVTGLFSDWHTATSADPYLAQADVNALLLFGVTREELERYGGTLGTALVAETSDLLLAQTAISRANLVIIDRWSLVSGVSERGSSTVTSDLRLVAEKQLGDFDFTVEKRLGSNIGSDWYASVERRLAERLYATAYVATRQEGRSLPIGAAYGAEFKLKWELD